MQREIAEKMAEELSTLNSCLNALASLSLNIADDGVRRSYRKELGVIMAEVDRVLIRPIAERFPDLDPISGS